MAPYRDWFAPVLALTIPIKQYIPPINPTIAPRITKRHLVPSRLSFQMPPRAGTVITPTKEVTMETHWTSRPVPADPSATADQLRLRRAGWRLSPSLTRSGLVQRRRARIRRVYQSVHSRIVLHQKRSRYRAREPSRASLGRSRLGSGRWPNRAPARQ